MECYQQACSILDLIDPPININIPLVFSLSLTVMFGLHFFKEFEILLPIDRNMNKIFQFLLRYIYPLFNTKFDAAFNSIFPYLILYKL